MGCNKCLVEFQRSLPVCASCICEGLEGLGSVITKFCDIETKLVESVGQGIEKFLRGSDDSLCCTSLVPEEMVEEGRAIAFVFICNCLHHCFHTSCK